MAFILLPACRDPQSAALKQLTARGYSLSVPEFFKAAKADDVAALQWFVKAGMEPNVADAKGVTAVAEAVRAGKAKALRVLLDSGAKLPESEANSAALLIDAVRSHDMAVLRVLLDAGANLLAVEGESALVVAAREQQREMVDLLAPLSAGQERAALVAAAGSGDVAVMSSLLKAGASVFDREEESLRTPLMIAVEAGHSAAAELLLASGSNRLAVDAQGRCALDIAQDLKHVALVSMLSADPTLDERRLAKSLNGAELKVGRTARVLPDVQLVFLGLQEETLPFTLEATDVASATIRWGEGDKVAKLALEEPVPGTEWKLEKCVPTGLFFQPCATLRARGTSERVLLVKGLPTRYGKPRAWLKFTTEGEVLEAVEGDQFSIAGEHRVPLQVQRLTPMAATLLDEAAKITWTLKMGGMR